MIFDLLVVATILATLGSLLGCAQASRSHHRAWRAAGVEHRYHFWPYARDCRRPPYPEV